MAEIFSGQLFAILAMFFSVIPFLCRILKVLSPWVQQANLSEVHERIYIISYRKSITWRQKSKQWTENEWPSDHEAKWTVTVIPLQSSIRLKANQVSCVHICISLNANDISPILHTYLTSCWSCLCSTAGFLVFLLWFWVVRVKKKKTRASNWF